MLYKSPDTPKKRRQNDRFLIKISIFVKKNILIFVILIENFSSPKELKECVVTELGRLLSINGPKLDKRIIQKMGSRSKKDRVDLLLIGELREEEKVWTDYQLDEQTVKEHLTDSIFTLLIDDTLNALKQCIH